MDLVDLEPADHGDSGVAQDHSPHNPESKERERKETRIPQSLPRHVSSYLKTSQQAPPLKGSTHPQSMLLGIKPFT